MSITCHRLVALLMIPCLTGRLLTLISPKTSVGCVHRGAKARGFSDGKKGEPTWKVCKHFFMQEKPAILRRMPQSNRDFRVRASPLSSPILLNTPSLFTGFASQALSPELTVSPRRQLLPDAHDLAEGLQRISKFVRNRMEQMRAIEHPQNVAGVSNFVGNLLSSVFLDIEVLILAGLSEEVIEEAQHNIDKALTSLAKMRTPKAIRQFAKGLKPEPGLVEREIKSLRESLSVLPRHRKMKSILAEVNEIRRSLERLRTQFQNLSVILAGTATAIPLARNLQHRGSSRLNRPHFLVPVF